MLQKTFKMVFSGRENTKYFAMARLKMNAFMMCKSYCLYKNIFGVPG